jgi:hypothetical protein
MSVLGDEGFDGFVAIDPERTRTTYSPGPVLQASLDGENDQRLVVAYNNRVVIDETGTRHPVTVVRIEFVDVYHYAFLSWALNLPRQLGSGGGFRLSVADQSAYKDFVLSGDLDVESWAGPVLECRTPSETLRHFRIVWDDHASLDVLAVEARVTETVASDESVPSLLATLEP